MIRFFTFFALLSFTFLSAQEKIFMNEKYEVVKDSSLATFYKIEEKISAGDAEVLRKTYRINGQISAEQYFSMKKGKTVNEGRHRFWYESGEPFYELEYKNGERHGELVAWWKDGSKRRHDFYKNDKFKSGTVWNEQGEETEHFLYYVPASFPGGNDQIPKYLTDNLPVPEKQKTGTTVKVAVIFTINKEGIINNVQIIEGAPHWYNSVTTQVLTNMPRWTPAMWFGEPVPSSFGLPVSFRK